MLVSRASVGRWEWVSVPLVHVHVHTQNRWTGTGTGTCTLFTYFDRVSHSHANASLGGRGVCDSDDLFVPHAVAQYQPPNNLSCCCSDRRGLCISLRRGGETKWDVGVEDNGRAVGVETNRKSDVTQSQYYLINEGKLDKIIYILYSIGIHLFPILIFWTIELYGWMHYLLLLLLCLRYSILFYLEDIL